MADLLAGIEQLAPVEALKAAFVAYPLVNALHVLSIGLLVTGVLLMDLRIIGAFARMPQAPFVALMRRVAVAGFAGAVASGLPMFAIRAGDYAANSAFRVKLALIALAGLNLLAYCLARRGGSEAKVFAASSMTIWLGVLLAGRFVGYVE